RREVPGEDAAPAELPLEGERDADGAAAAQRADAVGRGGRPPPGGGAAPPAPLRLARARRGGRTAGGGRALGLDLCVDRAPGIEQEAAQQRGDHVPTSSATLRRRCRQSSLPSTSMVSNRGGDASRPVTASRSTKNRCLV